MASLWFWLGVAAVVLVVAAFLVPRLRRPAVPDAERPRSRPYATRREGLWVQSEGERRIANWLESRGVPFRYEPEVAGLRPDFQVEGTKVLIEYWGMASDEGYERRMVRKIRRYEAAGYHVVSLFPAHVHEIEKVLAEELARAGVG